MSSSWCSRTSEILALRYADVDLASRPPTASITGTIVAKVGEGLLRQPAPKSRSGVRALPLPAFAVEVLVRRLADAADRHPTDGIFLTKRGTWMSQQNINRAWRVARADAGLTWVTFVAAARLSRPSSPARSTIRPPPTS